MTRRAARVIFGGGRTSIDYKDYYKILGLKKGATDKEIKAAYRKLARKHHPDLNAGNKSAEGRFKEINEANEVLSDPEKRKRYDQLGADWDKVGAQPGGASGFPGGFNVRTEGFGGGGGDFSDFFRTFFGGGGGGFGDAFSQARARRPPPSDIEQDVELSLEQLFQGTTLQFEVRDGESTQHLEVKIPAGLREGSRVRMAGKGGNGGDIYLRVHLAPHPVFERRGDDLAARVKAPLTTVVLGGEVEVPTLEGNVSIKVPAGTPADRSFRLRGKGLPRQEKGERGDLLISVDPLIPSDLEHREKELFEELKRMGR